MSAQPLAIERDGVTPEQWAMVEANMGLVGWRLARMGMSGNEDAHADGVIGLIRAVQLYDPSLGYRLSTYAASWIRQAIQRGEAARRGRSFRSLDAAGRGHEWRYPLTIDDDTDGREPISETLEATDDPERVALGVELLAEVVATMRAACLDDIDRALVDHCGMLATEPRTRLYEVVEAA